MQEKIKVHVPFAQNTAYGVMVVAVNAMKTCASDDRCNRFQRAQESVRRNDRVVHGEVVE